MGPIKEVAKCRSCGNIKHNPEKHCQGKGCRWWRCDDMCKAVNDEDHDRFFIATSRAGL